MLEALKNEGAFVNKKIAISCIHLPTKMIVSMATNKGTLVFIPDEGE